MGDRRGPPPAPPSPPPRPLWQAIAIGFAANNVLPLRAGEVLRIGAGSRLARWPLGAVLSSVAIERVLDALTVVALLGVGLLAANLPADLRLGGGPELAPLARRTGLIGLGALAIALIAAWRRVAAVALLRRILPSGRVSDRIARFSDETLHGLTAMHSWRRAIPALLWSVVIWLVNAAALWTAFTAFHFTVPWSGALIVQGALMLAIAVPSSPSYIGVFEAVIPLALSIYGIDHTAALACALLYHVATFIPITVLGAIAAVRTGTTLRASAAV